LITVKKTAYSSVYSYSLFLVFVVKNVGHDCTSSACYLSLKRKILATNQFELKSYEPPQYDKINRFCWNSKISSRG